MIPMSGWALHALIAAWGYGAIAGIVLLGNMGIPVPEDSVARTLKFVDGLPPDGTASMQRDLVAGRPTELEAQSGAVVRLGRARKFPTPVHEFIYNAMLPGELRARGKISF